MDTKKLPIYKLSISDDEESTVSFVALVDNPATERNWFAFNKQSKKIEFKADPKRRIVTGALMVADLPIYRFNNETKEEYYVVFDASQIERVAQKFFKQGNISNVNLAHNPSDKVDGVFMFESFIIDSSRGMKVPEGFSGITEGSWMGSYKVENEDVWKRVIDGTFNGFSVEGMFDMQLQKKTQEDEIIDLINEISKL